MANLSQPFNHPLLIAIKKIAPALAAGNSIVVKPSELAPISVLVFAAMAQEVGGQYLAQSEVVEAWLTISVVPSGVLSVLPGYGKTVGKELASNPLVRKVDITVSHLARISHSVSYALS